MLNHFQRIKKSREPFGTLQARVDEGESKILPSKEIITHYTKSVKRFFLYAPPPPHNFFLDGGRTLCYNVRIR